MRYRIFGKGIFPLTITLWIIFLSFNLYAQNSKWSVNLGYEQVYVNESSTNGLAMRNWIWNDPNRGELFSARASLPHGAHLGVSYELFKFLSIRLDFKKYFRRYYVWDGTYLNEAWEGHDPGQYKIVPFSNGIFRDMFLGRTLNANSVELRLDFSHYFTKSEKWKLHYFISLNRDRYEVNLSRFDNVDFLQGNSWYLDVETNQRIEAEVEGIFEFKAENRLRSPYQASASMGLGLSKSFKRGVSLRLELGFRNIYWRNNLHLEENHWELDLIYREFDQDQELVYENSTTHEFPLEIGGYYSNLTLSFKPFRSRKDRPDYVKKPFRLPFKKKN